MYFSNRWYYYYYYYYINNNNNYNNIRNFETYGPINEKGTKFIQELGRRLRIISDDPRESAFHRQRISIILQAL